MRRSVVAVAILSGLLGLICSAELAADIHPQPTSSEHDKAVALVRLLGDEAFPVREDAQQRLLELGPVAKQALREGLQSSDPEVRMRCERILFTVLEEDFQNRLRDFLADKDGQHEHDLPGWKRYRQLVGADAVARNLYADMVRACRPLLEEADTSPQTVGARYAQECQTLFQQVFAPLVSQRRPVTLGETAALLFVAADPQARISDQARAWTLNLLHQPAFREALRQGDHVEPVRKLFAAWISQASGPAAAQTLNLAIQYNLREGLDLALKLLQNKEHASGMALAAVGKFGGPEHLPVLEPLLEDKTVLTTINFNGKQGTAEVRDVALAMTLHLSGRSIRDYGYEFYRFPNNDQAFLMPAYLAFSSDAKRDLVFRTWEQDKTNSAKP